MFPQDEDDMPAIVGDLERDPLTGKIIEQAEPALVLEVVKHKFTATPDGMQADVKPLTLQEINASAISHISAANVLTSTIFEMQRVLEKKLRDAFEAGEDLSRYSVELVKASADVPETPAPKSKKK